MTGFYEVVVKHCMITVQNDLLVFSVACFKRYYPLTQMSPLTPVTLDLGEMIVIQHCTQCVKLSWLANLFNMDYSICTCKYAHL